MKTSLSARRLRLKLRREAIFYLPYFGSAAAAKRRGVKLGCPDRARSVKLMLAGAQAAKNEFKTKMLPVVNEIMATGVKTLQGVADAVGRRGYTTRQGKTKWHPGSGSVRYLLLNNSV